MGFLLKIFKIFFASLGLIVPALFALAFFGILTPVMVPVPGVQKFVVVAANMGDQSFENAQKIQKPTKAQSQSTPQKVTSGVASNENAVSAGSGEKASVSDRDLPQTGGDSAPEVDQQKESRSENPPVEPAGQTPKNQGSMPSENSEPIAEVPSSVPSPPATMNEAGDASEIQPALEPSQEVASEESPDEMVDEFSKQETQPVGADPSSENGESDKVAEEILDETETETETEADQDGFQVPQSIKRRIASAIRCETSNDQPTPDIVWKLLVKKNQLKSFKTQSQTTLLQIAEEKFGEQACWAKLWSVNPEIVDPYEVPAGTQIYFTTSENRPSLEPERSDVIETSEPPEESVQAEGSAQAEESVQAEGSAQAEDLVQSEGSAQSEENLESAESNPSEDGEMPRVPAQNN